MVIHSPFPDVDFQQTNIVFRLFPPGYKPSGEPLWIDSKDTNVSLSPAQLLGWMKRLACGLEKSGLTRGDVVMIYTPNHIFVPASYLGISGGRYAFSGASPVNTANGKSESCPDSEVILTNN
jgi:4-coumarate--CoA ligase